MPSTDDRIYRIHPNHTTPTLTSNDPSQAYISKGHILNHTFSPSITYTYPHITYTFPSPPQVTQLAMDDAGVKAAQLPQNTAVYVSMKMAEQTMMSAENLFFLNQYILTGGAHTVCANRINFFYDVRGPSMGVEGLWHPHGNAIHICVCVL